MKKRKNKKGDLIWVILIILFSIVSFGFGNIVLNNLSTISIVSTVSTEITTNETEIITKCSNLSVFQTADCFTKSIRPFYIYNLTDDKITLTFNELKESGGDCKDWSELYMKWGKKLGFYSDVLQFTTNETKEISLTHMVTVLSDSTGYCILDQPSFYCLNFQNKSKSLELK